MYNKTIAITTKRPVQGIDGSWPKQCEKLEALTASLIPFGT